MKEQFRGAAVALFFAGSVLAYIYFFHIELIDANESSSAVPSEASDASVVSELEETVTTLEDTNETLSLQIRELTEEIASLEMEQEENGASEDLNEPPMIHAMLEISQGETTSDISERLFDLRLIDSRNQFEADLIGSGRAQQIQTGSFFLTSDMDNQAIIDIVTTP